ncbi:MAG: hypothetical protein ABI651_07810 [Verrucomicrobiota bacterium]
MSTTPEPELDLDLHFLPAWAQKSSDVNPYAKYEGGGEDRRGYRGDRPESRQRREFGDRRGPRPERAKSGRENVQRTPAGPPGSRPEPNRREGGSAGQFGNARRDDRREASQALPELETNFAPEEKGVESLARQIKLSGRAYPLFEIAQLVLKKPERYHVQFRVIKKPDGQPVQPLWVCNLDETVWLSEQDAVNHVVGRHFGTFYQTEKIPTDPPKGTYTFVAQCGMSGVVLGPPNYHDYQNKLRKLHAERFSRIPFEGYKARVKIVRDEAVVKQWLEEQSFKTEYNCLNVPEAKKLASREEVELHFRETHLPNIIRQVDSFTVSNPAGRSQLPPALQALSRWAWEDQRRFPIKIVTSLSQQFAAHGLQFFKVNKTVTHVAVARPHHLDMIATPVSEGVRRIVEFIDATKKCTRRQLFATLAPAPAPPPGTAESADDSSKPVETPEPAPEMKAVIGDLHWLIHQGHVIEFANGILETARPPAPRPQKSAPKVATPKPEGTGAKESAPAPSAPEAAPSIAAAASPVRPVAEATPGTEKASTSTTVAEPVAENSSVPTDVPVETVSPNAS